MFWVSVGEKLFGKKSLKSVLGIIVLLSSIAMVAFWALSSYFVDSPVTVTKSISWAAEYKPFWGASASLIILGVYFLTVLVPPSGVYFFSSLKDPKNAAFIGSVLDTVCNVLSILIVFYYAWIAFYCSVVTMKGGAVSSFENVRWMALIHICLYIWLSLYSKNRKVSERVYLDFGQKTFSCDCNGERIFSSDSVSYYGSEYSVKKVKGEWQLFSYFGDKSGTSLSEAASNAEGKLLRIKNNK